MFNNNDNSFVQISTISNTPTPEQHYEQSESDTSIPMAYNDVFYPSQWQIYGLFNSILLSDIAASYHICLIHNDHISLSPFTMSTIHHLHPFISTTILHFHPSSLTTYIIIIHPHHPPSLSPSISIIHQHHITHNYHHQPSASSIIIINYHHTTRLIPIWTPRVHHVKTDRPLRIISSSRIFILFAPEAKTQSKNSKNTITYTRWLPKPVC